VIAVASDEGAHDADLVRQASKSGESAAERDARECRFDFACGTTDSRRHVHLRIERLKLRGPAVHEEKDDGTILERELPPGRGGAHREPVAQGQPTEGKTSHAQELTAVPAPSLTKVILETQHRRWP
jgi:hypothetical protein